VEDTSGSTGDGSKADTHPTTFAPVLIPRLITQAMIAGTYAPYDLSNYVHAHLPVAFGASGRGGNHNLIYGRLGNLSCSIPNSACSETPAILSTNSQLSDIREASSDGSVIRYTLRSREIFDSGGPLGGRGLGTITDEGGRGRGRGRHSYLAKAQSKACLDVAAGRQT